MRAISILFAISILILSTGYFCPAMAVASADPEIASLVKFLVSKDLLIVNKEGDLVPPSYYVGTQSDIDKYFGDYICAQNNTCAVVDSLYNNPYAILGKGLPPQEGTEQEKMQAQAQIERADMKYGADIYDAATWQVALALAGKNNYLDKSTAKNLVANQLESISNPENRATDSSFQYGYQKAISDSRSAFTFRMIATNFHNKDPFYYGKYHDKISWDYDIFTLAKNDLAHHSPDYYEGISTWSDWKPITGENAWAQLIGPLQAEYLLNQGKVAVNSVALQNAMQTLKAFSSMQAGIGAFYYAPGGSEGNQGPITPGEISVENNFSTLGGLQILKHILQNAEQTDEVQKALEQVNTMLYGGVTVNGFKTVGLLSFIYNGAYDKQHNVFYTHGIAPISSALNDWQPDTSRTSGAMAIDINTWGIAALGVETVDKWFGEGTALKIWQDIRNHGGYFHQGQLWGVGYTFNNNQGVDPERIMSAEWTAGAINTVESLISYYESKGVDTTALKNDLISMQSGIKHLRNDQYLNANFDGATPVGNFVKLPKNMGQAYLYASKRFAIPFGWNANTLPSVTSNAWVIMNRFHFNPFQYQGKLIGEDYVTPDKINLSSRGEGHGESIENAVDVSFNKGDLLHSVQLSLSYSLDSSPFNWTSAATITAEETGLAHLPAGTKAISIAYYDNHKGWFGACQLIPATKICKDDACSTLYTIATHWSADGKGECQLMD